MYKYLTIDRSSFYMVKDKQEKIKEIQKVLDNNEEYLTLIKEGYTVSDYGFKYEQYYCGQVITMYKENNE